MTQEFSVSPDGTKYGLPEQKDYSAEFERLKGLVEKARQENMEIVVYY